MACTALDAQALLEVDANRAGLYASLPNGAPRRLHGAGDPEGGVDFALVLEIAAGHDYDAGW